MNRILKVITLELVVVFMVGCLAGCGSKSSFKSLDKVAPDPKVVIGNDIDMEVFDTPDGTTYYFMVHNCDKDTFKKYVQACKDAGFGTKGYDLEKSFGGYTEDKKYWIETGLNDTGDEYVICQISKDFTDQYKAEHPDQK